MQMYGSSSGCLNSSNPLYCEMIMQAYERNDRRWAAQNGKVTANSRQLVLNASIPHRYGRKSPPLIPPTMADILGLNSVVTNEADGPDYGSGLPLPRTVEIIANERQAEWKASAGQSAEGSSDSRGSGPLIPPKLW